MFFDGGKNSQVKLKHGMKSIPDAKRLALLQLLMISQSHIGFYAQH
jgi:hypothetical protein